MNSQRSHSNSTLKAINFSKQATLDINNTIVMNISNCLQTLPPRSPLRQPLIFYVTKNIPKQQSQLLLNISSSTYLAKRGKGAFFKTLKYTPKSHKQKIGSLRNFRRQTLTNKRLYELYLNKNQVPSIPPLSKSSFIKLLKEEKIHHSKDASGCDKCLRLEVLERKEIRTPEEEKEMKSLREHKEKLIEQYRCYLEVKNDIANGDSPLKQAI